MVKNIFAFILFAIIFSFVAVFAHPLVSALISGEDKEIAGMLYAAFFGAFFAFLFSRLAEAFSKIYENQSTGYRALVLMQYFHQDIIYQLKDVRLISADMTKQFKKVVSQNSRSIYPINIPKIIVTKDNLSNIRCLELINEEIGFQRNLQVLTQGIELINEAYNTARHRFLETNDFETYKGNLPFLIEKLDELANAIPAAEETNLAIFSKVIVLARRRPFFTGVLSVTSRIYISKEDQARAGLELADIKAKIKKTES
jgi:hypothetical protein